MSTSRRRAALAVILLLIIVVLLLLLGRCSRTAAPRTDTLPPSTTPAEKSEPTKAQAATPETPEALTPAKLTAVARALAGAPVSVQWDGPNNRDDYITIVAPEAPASAYANYTLTSTGDPLQITAPIAPGTYELRYVAARSKTILGRAPLEVVNATVSLEAPDHAPAGSNVSVTWVGPNNPGDYVSFVPKGSPDRTSGNYVYTREGSPTKVRLPPEPGEAELRYVSGQGDIVLARRPIRVEAPTITLNAPMRVTAGAKVAVEWNGPSGSGDYLTIVPRDLPDGRYGNNTVVSGSPTKVLAPIDPGSAEIRFMSGQGGRVFARRSIEIVAAEITLSAPDSVVAGAEVPITWTGPKNDGDYITIVPKTLPDGRYAHYATLSGSSTVKVLAPLEAGAAEIRYMSGQGDRVLARRALTLTPIQITLDAPAEARVGSIVAITWTGPNYHGDYLTIVPAGARDGVYEKTEYTTRGSPLKVQGPDKPGAAEIRYMSGQGGKVLARRPITLAP